MSLSAAAVLYVPFIVLFIWASAFVLGVYFRALAPGSPVRVVYQASGGHFALSAKSFFADPGGKVFTAYRVEIQDSTRQVVAKAEKIVAKYDPLKISIDVVRPHVTIVRRPDKSFSILDALPVQTEDREERMFSVTVRHATLSYIDATKQPHLNLSASIPEVKVDALGANLLGKTEIVLQGAGKLPISFEAADSFGVLIKSNLKSFQAAALAGHLDRWLPADVSRQYSPIAARSLLVSGPLELRLPKEGEVEAQGTIGAEGQRVSLGRFASNASVRWKGRLDRTSASGNLKLTEPNRQAEFEGIATWNGPVRLAGRFSARLASKAAAWADLREALPEDLGFRSLSLSGNLRLDGNRYALQGMATAPEARWGDFQFSDNRWSLALDERSLALQVNRAKWEGVPAAGRLMVNFQKQTINGLFKAQTVDLGRLAKRYGEPRLSGRTGVELAILGSLEKPVAHINARGTALWNLETGVRPIYLGLFEGRAQFKDQKLRVQRLAVSGPNGALSLAGVLAPTTRKLEFALKGGNIALRAYSEDLTGIGFFSGKLGGTMDRPEVEGDLDVFGLVVAEKLIPAIEGRIHLNRDRLMVQSLAASSGGSSVTGSLELNIASRALSGKLSGEKIQLADWFGEDAVGLVDARRFVVSGTLAKPQISGTISAKDVSVAGIDLDGAEGDLAWGDGRIHVSNAAIRLGDGTLSGRGWYDLTDQDFQFAGNLVNLPLANLPVGKSLFAFGGTAEGDAELSGNFKTKDIDGTGRLRARNVTFDGKRVGSGFASVQAKDGLWTGEASIGEQDRFFVLENASFDSRTEAIAARLDVLNLDVRTWLQPAIDSKRESFPDWLLETVRTASGSLSTSVLASGTLKDPAIELKDATVEQLKFREHDFGKLALNARREGDTWGVQHFEWKRGPMLIAASGQVSEAGVNDLKATLKDVDLKLLADFNPNLPSIDALANGSMALGGTIDDPTLAASLLARYSGKPLAEGDAPPPMLDIASLTVQNREFDLKGRFEVEGFSGTLQAAGPLAALAGEPPKETANIVAKAVLDNREMVDLAKYVPALDADRLGGTIAGSLEFTGKPNDYSLIGNVSLTNGAFATKALNTSLENVLARIEWRGEDVAVTASAKSTGGGTVGVQATATPANLFDKGMNFEQFLKKSSVAGTVLFKDFGVQESSTNKNPDMELTVKDGQLAFSGPVSDPKVTGNIVLGTIDTVIPKWQTNDLAPPTPIVNPVFDNVRISTSSPAVVRTFSGNLKLGGFATLGGNLQYPLATANMSVEEGVFNLLNSRIELEEGGQMAFRYDASPRQGAVAVLDLNLIGKTNITARSLATGLERYEVTIGITGDLLRDNGLRLVATSDPPDLSQDQILSILGQAELIKGLTDQAKGTGSSSFVRDTLFTYALPSLTGSLTRNLATSLGLDYIFIEYNPFDHFTVTAAKTIAQGLSLVGRRSLSSYSVSGTAYELKLVYRLPSRNRILSRTRFSIGFDQKRPWKIGVSYSTRF